MSTTPSPSTSFITSTAGRGRGSGYRGRGGRGGRGHGGGSGEQKKNKAIFKGNTPEMNNNVFECYDEQSDRRQYSKSLEALQSYAKKNLRHPDDLAKLFGEEMKAPTVAKPTELLTTATEMDKLIFAEEIKEYVKRLTVLRSNVAAIHAVVWGQCSEAMKAKVKSMTDYQAKVDENDCMWLLKQIKAITLQFDEKKNKFISLLDARTSLLNCKQFQGQSNDEYLESLRGWADTIEYHGGTVAENFTIVPEVVGGVTRTDAKRKDIARDSTLAILLIRRADPTKYGTLITELSNKYAMGHDEYPTDLSSAYSLLVNYKTPTNARVHQQHTTPAVAPNTTPAAATPESSAMTFAQKAAIQPGVDGVTHSGVTCFRCQGTGHYADECPTGETTTSLVQHGYMLTQTSHNGIDPSWILLDSQSTISVFRNPKMLTNIRESNHTLRAITNGGHQDSHMVGTFHNLGEVWYNSESIANILSLSAVRKVCRVTMDSTAEPAINVHRLDGTVMKFVEHESGLYIYSTNNNNINEKVTGYTLIAAVAEQKKMFSRRQIQDADNARALYRKLGRPAEAEFYHILSGNLLRNCPVTVDDAKRALTIYGPDIATIKGKTTRTDAADRVPTFEAVPLPPTIMEHHRNVTLCVDFFFVQGLTFLHTISRGIGFRTVSLVAERTKPIILKEVQAVLNVYTSRGFSVCDIHGDKKIQLYSRTCPTCSGQYCPC
jgi:ribosomal protein L15